MTLTREKEVLLRMIKLYKEFSFLWNRNHEHYSNKVKRLEAQNQILKVYREFEPSVTLKELKKKLENMKTSYKKIRSKVLKAQAEGETLEPTLWYFHELKFIDEANTDTNSENEQLEIADDDEDNEEIDYFKSETNSPPVLNKVIDKEYLKAASRSRSNSPTPQKKRKSNFVFLAENEPGSNNNLPTFTNHSFGKNTLECSSTDCFGKTVALQLDELQPLQRYIAEKLISDVIFNARLNRLCPETSISLNN